MDSSGSKPRNPSAHPRHQRKPCWVRGRRAGRCMLPPLMSSNLPGTPMLQINSKFNFVPTSRQLHLSRPPLPFSALVQGAGGNSFSEPVETRQPMETNPLHSASCGLGWVLPIDRVSRTMNMVTKEGYLSIVAQYINDNPELENRFICLGLIVSCMSHCSRHI